MGAGIKPESLEGMSSPNHGAVSPVPQYYYLGTNTFNPQRGFNSLYQANLCVSHCLLVAGTKHQTNTKGGVVLYMAHGSRRHSPSRQKSRPAFAVKRS